MLFLSAPLQGGSDGKIAGRITDFDGAPLPGADVYLQALETGAISDATGHYAILGLPPGRYSLRTSLIGYGTVTVQGIAVSADQTTIVNLTLELAPLEAAPVVVMAPDALIQADLTATRRSIARSEISILPAEDIASLLQTMAGAVAGADGSLHIRGGRSGEVVYLLDGLPVNDPFTSQLGLPLATNMIAELSLVTGAFSAEYGRAMSGVVNLVTRAGGRHFRGSISQQSGDMYSGQTDIFDAVDRFEPLTFSRTDFSLEGPLPLLPGGTFLAVGSLQANDGWLFGYREHNTWDFASLETGSEPFVVRTGDSARVGLNPRQSAAVMAKLSFRPWPNGKITYQLHRFESLTRRYEQAWKFNPDGRTTYEDRAILQSLHFSQTLSPRSTFSLRLAIRRSLAEQYVHKLEMPYKLDENFYGRDLNGDGLLTVVTVDWAFIRRYGAYLPNDLWYRLQVPGEYIDGAAGWFEVLGWNADSSVAEIWVPRYVPYSGPSQVRSTVPEGHFIYGSQQDNYRIDDAQTRTLILTFTSQINPAHQLRLGAELNLYRLHANHMIISITEGNNWQPWIPAVSEAGLSHVEYTRRPYDIAAYLQNKIELQNMVLQAGIRFDYFEPADSTFSDPANPLRDTPAQPKVQISPRVGISIPISERGFIRFSYGHFFRMPGMAWLYRNPDLKRVTGSNIQFGNPDLEPERTIMYELGLQQKLSATTALNVSLYYRDISNWLSSEDNFINNELRYTRYVARDYGSVRGITASYVRRKRAGLNLHIDYTLQVARGNSSSPDAVYYDNLREPPVISEKSPVPLDWDVRHSGGLTLSGQTRGGLMLGLIGKLASGRPYTPANAQGERLGAENSARTPGTFTIDLRASKLIDIGGQHLTATFKVYNLLDRRNERTVFPETGRASYSLRPAQGGGPAELFPTLAGAGVYTLEERLYSPLNYQPPRQILVSLGWDF